MRKLIRLLLGLIACCMVAFGVHQMWIFGMESSASDKLNSDLVHMAVSVRVPESRENGESLPEDETLPPQEEEELELPPIQVDFEALKDQSQDIMGWLYCEGTQLNLPVAQGTDNDYYLRRLLDGTGNNSGTLFADYRNKKDFSDYNTIIYGHNMRNGTMFGSLRNYSQQSYYEEHPVLWLLTPEQNYKVELVAGYTTGAVSQAYIITEFPEDAQEQVRLALEKTTFQANLELNEDDRFITLSTCTYEFEDARYVLIGRLVKAGME